MTGFSDVSNDEGKGDKSFLLFPGRWEGFDVRECQTLSQSILRDVGKFNFRVFICAKAHPFATHENFSELSPLLAGVGLKGRDDFF